MSEQDWYTASIVAYEDREQSRKEKQMQEEIDEANKVSHLFMNATDINPGFTKRPYILEVDGKEYEFDYKSKAEGTWPVTYHLVMVGKCTDCGLVRFKKEVSSKADIGEAIKRWLPNLLCTDCNIKRVKKDSNIQSL